jgi:hypothetical protein
VTRIATIGLLPPLKQGGRTPTPSARTAPRGSRR